MVMTSFGSLRHPSKVVITTIKLDKDRRAILDRKDRKKAAGQDVEMVD